MGQLDILPNTPKLWQSMVHELVRAALYLALRTLPASASAISTSLQIHPLSLSVLNGHLEHVLGKNWSQGTSAVKSHISQVRSSYGQSEACAVNAACSSPVQV